MSALGRADVGQYLNRHFVSAFQKVATFQINRGQKQGGNVASYFCTPQGQVLHVLAGPVDGDTFLREARWANESYQLAQLNKPAAAELETFFRWAHRGRLEREHNLIAPADRPAAAAAVDAKYFEQLLERNRHLGVNNQGKVHLLLAVSGLPRIEHVYQTVFEQILNEKISTSPVAVAR